jgi:hypothetical protein
MARKVSVVAVFVVTVVEVMADHRTAVGALEAHAVRLSGKLSLHHGM